MNAVEANKIFELCVAEYHLYDNVDAVVKNPFAEGSEEALFFEKCLVDAVQWHLEDLIRDPEIDPAGGMALKRRIDRSNQVRTDMVERIDDSIAASIYADGSVRPADDAPINTESPAWAYDRLSILALKIWHMREQAERDDVSPEHIERSVSRLKVLLEQQHDLINAIDTLMDDYRAGRKRMKVYRQMKLYNDPTTNPVLYSGRQETGIRN